MNLTLGVIAALLTSVVAVYSAWADKLPKPLVAMLVIASLASVAALFWTAAEQGTFEKKVLGGDGFVFVTFEQVASDASKFELQHGGDEFNVYDLHLEVYDLRKFVGVTTGDPRVITQYVMVVDRPVFGPGTKTAVFNTTHPQDCFGYWAAMSYQRNQNVMSIISARIVDGKWESNTRVLTMDAARRELKRVASPGWLDTFPEASVQIEGPGRFQSSTPPVACPP